LIAVGEIAAKIKSIILTLLGFRQLLLANPIYKPPLAEN